MKKKKILYIVLCLLIVSGLAILMVLKYKKEKEPEYMPCPVLEDGETMDVIIPSSLYDGSSASYTARCNKKEGRCVDAWVNEDGELVKRFDRETLEKEYKRSFDLLMKEVNGSYTYEESKVRIKVSYDFSELYFYVDDETEVDDFAIVFMVSPRACLSLRLLQGLSLEEATVDVIVIYEPTGKEILRIDEKTNNFHINQDGWKELIEEAKQEKIDKTM